MYLKKVAIFLIAPLLLCIATMAVFDRYLENTSYELISGWLKNEAVGIQEGGILSSITKNKRSVMSSDFVRGIWLVDDSNPRSLMVLADFGEKYPISREVLPKNSAEIKVQRISAFHRLALYRFPNRSDLVVIFNVQPDFIWPLFGVNLVAIFALLFLFFFIVRSFEKREANIKLAVVNEQAKLGAFARQISHDLKSPLTALDISVRSLTGLQENKRIELFGAVSGLRDIINSLLEKSFSSTRSQEHELARVPTAQLLSTLVEQQLSITRLQYRQRHEINISAELGPESYGIFARVNPTEFKRIISNLLSNAVEASANGGKITIRLTANGNDASLTVEDHGKGIPLEVLSKLGSFGFSHDKPAGNGTGLHFVKSTVESWDGALDISSVHGMGTTVSIRLPLAKAPQWFVPEIRLIRGSAVVLLDDAPSIHQIWKNRISAIEAYNEQISILSLASADELTQPLNPAVKAALKARQTLYLFDYELGERSKNGLDLILELGLASRAILVTSHFDDPSLIELCEKHKIKIIPKNLAGLVPISIVEPLLALDGVLIDNDALIHRTWSHSAQVRGKSIQSFFSVHEFIAASDGLDRETPIYVDSDLGNGERGEDLARYIQASGFKSIYLQTGTSPDQFLKPMPWIQGIIGKTPPWEPSA